MKASIKKTTIKTGSWLLAASCASILSFAPQALASISVPAAVNDHVPLGTAYNSISEKFLNYQTISGEVVQVNGAMSNIISKSDLSFQELSSRISGEGELSLDFPSVQADAGASVALSEASDEYTSNWIFSVINVDDSRALVGFNNATSPALSSAASIVAAEYANNVISDEQLLDRVGTGYVSKIKYGTQMLVTMKMEFANKADKMEISGYLDITAAGVLDAHADVNYLDEKTKNSVKITVSAQQYGGDPLSLLQILPVNILSCTMADPTACYDLFTNAVNYAKGQGTYVGNGFADQTANLATANVIGYEIDRYDAGSAAMDALVPSQGYIVSDNSVVIGKLEDKYLDELKNRKRAQSMQRTFSNAMLLPQISVLTDINRKASQNVFELATLVKKCTEKYLGTACSDYIDDNCAEEGDTFKCLEPYDTAIFELAFTGGDFFPFRVQYDLAKCLNIDGAYANGTNVNMVDCMGSDLPSWRYDASTEQVQAGYDFCLTGTTASNNVIIENCVDGNNNQKWNWDSENRLINAQSQNALDYNYTTGNVFNGNPHGGTNQKWVKNDYASYTSKATGKCLVIEGPYANGANVNTADCNGSMQQQWSYDPVTKMLINPSGYCLDDLGQAPVAGLNIYAWECNVFNNNQNWDWDATGLLMSSRTGMFMDESTHTNNVYQWGLHGGDNQIWEKH